jgi:hypothetical protein
VTGGVSTGGAHAARILSCSADGFCN